MHLLGLFLVGEGIGAASAINVAGVTAVAELMLRSLVTLYTTLLHPGWANLLGGLAQARAPRK